MYKEQGKLSVINNEYTITFVYHEGMMINKCRKSRGFGHIEHLIK
jgi:hypothetical protein